MWTREGWLYLAVVIDLLCPARRRLGRRATGSIRNWRCWVYAGPSPCGVHPPGSFTTRDRGSQYCSVEYQAELRKNGISISMSGKRKLLRQRHGRDVLQDPQGRTRPAHPLPEQDRSRERNRPLHRRPSTSSSAAIRRSTSSARFSSKGGQRKIENALHKCRASPVRAIRWLTPG